MAEHFIDAGAFTASTPRTFDLKSGTTVGPAAYYKIQKVKITNPTSARLTCIVDGRTFPVNPNGYAEQEFPGRVEDMQITSDTTISANKVTLGFEGPVLPVWGDLP